MFDNTPNNLPVGGKSFVGDDTPPASPKAQPIVSSVNIPPKATPVGASSQPPKPAFTPRPSTPPPAMKAAGLEPGRKADDMFEDVKEAPIAGGADILNRGIAPSLSKQTPELSKDATTVETPRQGFKKILIMIFSIVIFVGVIGFGGYWAYNQFLKPKPLNPNLNLNNSINTPPPQTQEQTPPVQAPVILDSDNDGLPDTEETTLGADPFNPDTDGDRLFDGEEANVYHTDPLNKDTDGDGFLDGAEVQSGYDPKGPGKLIQIPAGQQ